MNDTKQALEAAVGWQPIETAPRESVVVLFCDARGNRWTQTANCRLPFCGYPPTHWMPLPAPPAIDAMAAGGGE